jgi:hypothetical protein
MDDEMEIEVCEFGKSPQKVTLKDPEIAGIKRTFAEAKASGFWCECDNPETGRIIPVRHSVDVLCKNCNSYLQVG